MGVRARKRLLDEMSKYTNQVYMRKILNKQKHIVTVHPNNLVEAYKDSWRVAKQDELPEKAYRNAAAKSLTALKKYLANPRTRAKRAFGNPGCITYTANRNLGRPVAILKETALKILEQEAGKKLKTAKDDHTAHMRENPDSTRKISAFARGSEVGLFKSGIEQHHQGRTTVGRGSLEQAAAFIGRDKQFKEFLNSEEIKSIEQEFGPLDLMFETKGSKAKGFETTLRDEFRIAIDIGTYKSNFPGSADTDWAKIRPRLEQELLKWAKQQPWGKKEGSATLEQRAKLAINAAIAKEFAKMMSIRASTKKKYTDTKPEKVSIQSKSKHGAPKASTKKASSPRRNNRQKLAQPGIASSPLRLIGLINKELPEVVRRNMNAPALQNRTGRFAESVKVTDVVQTPRGFPSIGYTYRKNPYQVFESSSGSSLSSQPERDPRLLIDRSIREIAMQFAIGRFYTRRV